MAKIGRGGAIYSNDVQEVWEPTMHLAFIAVLDRDGPSPDRTIKMLHQQWRSNIGRTRWRPVVEMDPRSPDNE